MEIVYIIIGLIIGSLAGFFVAHFKAKSESSRFEERNSNLEKQLKEAESKLSEESNRANSLDNQLAGLNADYRNLEEKLSEQKKELSGMQEQLKVQFENLANKILEENTQKFTKQNKESLDQLLNPLGLKLEEFKKKVEDVHKDEVEARGSLKQELKNLMELNNQMSQDAKNLTNALKGESKTQGDFGEMILESILEKSGLEKGREYTVQEYFNTDSGQKGFFDVVINLPDDKYMIIDSKISLKSYLNYVSADPDEKERHIKDHLLSVRNHVKGLSKKDYQKVHGAKSPDFVIMFVANEPAYMLALQRDQSLFDDSFRENVLIVSPTTLLATLSIIQNLWKREKQNANAQKIADRAKFFLDKFTLLYETLEKLGDRLRLTSESYEQAMGQFKTGRGNLISQAKQLKKLGAQSAKSLPKSEFEDFDNDEV